MFARSAATDTLQGQAIHAVNVKWGDPHYKKGQESIGFPVCKKKYAPFRMLRSNSSSSIPPPTSKNDKNAQSQPPPMPIERMYGCACHSQLRKAVIEKHGERAGWEPFGQWSMQKAVQVARQSEKDDEEQENNKDETTMTVKCYNGACVWKVKSAYDDIYWELNGHSLSDAEDS